MSQLFASGGQSIGVSASTSVLAVSTQDRSLGRTGWLDELNRRQVQFFGSSCVCTLAFMLRLVLHHADLLLQLTVTSLSLWPSPRPPVFHPVECSYCRCESMMGFRYRCQQCHNYQLCQNCFWRGHASGPHSNQHQMKEHSSWVTALCLSLVSPALICFISNSTKGFFPGRCLSDKDVAS